jgi:3-oxoadipate enol-lactonase
MPYATNGNVRLYWESHGSGEPLLLITGLSFSLRMWSRIWPQLSEKYRVILLDNRGVGRSDVPWGPYSIRDMAKDALSVLTAAGERSAHVIGASMGGMIAQEIALSAPDRVRSLVLGCTTCAGPWFRFPNLKKIAEAAWRPTLSVGQKVDLTAHLLYGQKTPMDWIAEDCQIRKEDFPSMRGYLGQISSFVSWTSYFGLPKLRMPTLILHGDADQIVPIGNGRLLKQRIPHAQMEILPGAGHVFLTDYPERTRDLAFRFLESARQKTLAGAA